MYYPVSYTTACFWCGVTYWYYNDPNLTLRVYECTTLTPTFAFIKVGFLNGTLSNVTELFLFASMGF